MEPGQQLAIRVGEIFTPAAPIDKKALFAGRTQQVRQVVDAINQRGQHAIIFGERGVGKTSLANVLSENLSVPGGQILMPHINCDTEDDFTTLWRKVFSEISLYRNAQQAGYAGAPIARPINFAEGVSEPFSTGDIRSILTPLTTNFLVVIIFDEFDRLPGGAVRSMMADTIKMLSDRGVRATLVLIGVADSVDELVAEHQSIERNLIQIPMPRMSQAEITDIVNRGLDQLQMTIEPAALEGIAYISRGLPHYTHLLARLAARSAIDSGSMRITVMNVALARLQALSEAERTTGRAYHKATYSPKKKALYRQVLLACALAPTDELGFFAPADVRRPLNRIVTSKPKPYDISNFMGHLKEFCEEARGSILKREGTSHRFRYRFADPMMQPYVILMGLKDGWLNEETLGRSTKEGE